MVFGLGSEVPPVEVCVEVFGGGSGVITGEEEGSGFRRVQG